MHECIIAVPELIEMLFRGLACELKEQCVSWVSTLTLPGEYE